MGLLSTTKHFHEHDNSVNIEFPKTIEVKEFKAPTDASVKLLNEFEDKARKNILAKIHIDENHLKAVAIYYQEDFPMNRVTYHIKFTLNGKEYKIEDFIDNFDWKQELSKGYYGMMHEHIFKALHKKFAEMIAMELMKNCPEFLNSIIK